MALRFYSSLIDEDTGVGVQTGEGKGNVTVDQADFRGCDSGVLKFHRRPLFATQNYDGGSLHTHSTGASFDGFEGVLDLEDVAIRAKD